MQPDLPVLLYCSLAVSKAQPTSRHCQAEVQHTAAWPLTTAGHLMHLAHLLQDSSSSSSSNSESEEGCLAAYQQLALAEGLQNT